MPLQGNSERESAVNRELYKYMTTAVTNCGALTERHNLADRPCFKKQTFLK